MVQLSDIGFANPALREQAQPRPIAPSSDAISRYQTPYQPGTQPLPGSNIQEIANLPAPAPATTQSSTTAGPSPSVGPITSGATATAFSPPPAVAAGTGLSLTGDQRKGFVDAVFGSGAATGDASYWYQPQADDSDFIAAAMNGLQNPEQRRAIVDYLFDSGLATGDRNYWYESRGAEDASLVSTFAAQNASAGATPTGTSSGSGQRDIDALRQERLEAALGALNAAFDMDEGQLNAEKTGLENLFASSNKALDRGERDTTREINNQAVDRGLTRSSIRLQDLARGAAPFAEERADLLGSIGPGGLQIQQILSSLGLLDQQRASATASAELESRADELDLEQYIALLNAGLSGG